MRATERYGEKAEPVKVLTLSAHLQCEHLGNVVNNASQSFVKIGGVNVLVERDPEGRTIQACPNIGATIKPCTLTLVAQAGYSSYVKIGGHRVCLDTVTGLTDGTPPGVVKYSVKSPGQAFVNVIGD